MVDPTLSDIPVIIKLISQMKDPFILMGMCLVVVTTVLYRLFNWVKCSMLEALDKNTASNITISETSKKLCEAIDKMGFNFSEVQTAINKNMIVLENCKK